MVVQAVLLSPKFLFRPEIGDRAQAVAQGVPLTSWEMAARLSYFLTGSIPDAGAGRRRPMRTSCRSSDELVKQARRLLTSQRAQTNLVRFHLSGWGRTRRRRWPRTRTRSPTSLRCSRITWRRRRTVPAQDAVREQRHVRGHAAGRLHYANAPLAAFYGVADARATDWDARQARPQQRVGPADAGVAAGDDGERGSHRSGAPREVRAPADPVPRRESAVAGDRGDVQAAGSEQDGARAVQCQHAESDVCASCHRLLDPLGLAVRAL